MSIKVTPDKYPEIIEVYNVEGKTAAYDLIRSRFGIRNPTCLMKRLKNNGELGYNPEADRFAAPAVAEEKLFLDLEELCGSRYEAMPKAAAAGADRVKAMESMVHVLISDRLLEISRYVQLDPIGRKILIDRSSMQADGYGVIIS